MVDKPKVFFVCVSQDTQHVYISVCVGVCMCVYRGDSWHCLPGGCAHFYRGEAQGTKSIKIPKVLLIPLLIPLFLLLPSLSKREKRESSTVVCVCVVKAFGGSLHTNINLLVMVITA